MAESFSDRVIVALDRADLKEVKELLQKLKGTLTYFKIGYELFTSHGWKAVELVKHSGGRVFLDLKLHDIPNTVKKTIRTICEHDIDMVNVHALGGLEMMKEAASEAKKVSTISGKKDFKIIAVTILTSHTSAQLSNEMGIHRSLEEEVLVLGRLAKQAGMDGVVSSPWEISLLKERLGNDFCIVTPGIRPAGADAGDQKRICTPLQAFQAGSDYIVIGRPITEAPDPAASAEAVLASLKGITAVNR